MNSYQSSDKKLKSTTYMCKYVNESRHRKLCDHNSQQAVLYKRMILSWINISADVKETGEMCFLVSGILKTLYYFIKRSKYPTFSPWNLHLNDIFKYVRKLLQDWICMCTHTTTTTTTTHTHTQNKRLRKQGKKRGTKREKNL